MAQKNVHYYYYYYYYYPLLADRTNSGTAYFAAGDNPGSVQPREEDPDGSTPSPAPGAPHSAPPHTGGRPRQEPDVRHEVLARAPPVRRGLRHVRPAAGGRGAVLSPSQRSAEPGVASPVRVVADAKHLPLPLAGQQRDVLRLPRRREVHPRPHVQGAHEPGDVRGREEPGAALQAPGTRTLPPPSPQAGGRPHAGLRVRRHPVLRAAGLHLGAFRGRGGGEESRARATRAGDRVLQTQRPPADGHHRGAEGPPPHTDQGQHHPL